MIYKVIFCTSPSHVDSFNMYLREASQENLPCVSSSESFLIVKIYDFTSFDAIPTVLFQKPVTPRWGSL